MQGLKGDDLVEKLSFWQDRLDFYLWADPAEEILAVGSQSKPVLRFVDRLRAEQQQLRQFLLEQGIERIDAQPGSEFIPGLIEHSNKPPEPTTNPALHDRVFQIEPGDGGYRVRGRVVTYSLARRYEFHPSGE